MKKILFLLMTIAIALASCAPGPRPSEAQGYSYFFRKDGKKIYWGVRDGHEKTIVPANFDTIWVAEVFLREGRVYFVARKDGHNTLYDYQGRKKYEKFLLAKQENLSGTHGRIFGPNMSYYSVQSEDGSGGIISAPLEDWAYGPYEKFHPFWFGFIFSQNGHYGYMRVEKQGQADGNREPVKDEKLLLPPEYDEVYEVIDPFPKYELYILARKDKDWVLLDMDGNKAAKSPRYYVKYLKRKTINLGWYMRLMSLKPGIYRTGWEKAGGLQIIR